jgi:DNA polymerase
MQNLNADVTVAMRTMCSPDLYFGAKQRHVVILKMERHLHKLWTSIGRKEKVYDIMNCGPRHQFMVITDFGPVIAHNCVQGVARDLLMWGMKRLERAGYTPLFSVHDEPVCEKKKGLGSVDEFVKILCQKPSWAQGCPIEAKGWTGPRYKKG